ncbi:MAG: UDP-N-acetylmuramoyl-L-alanine--D-glutamate ligase [Proteobacteria bacterium]|nr:UDP-N-acetylmuramoyl-L-alanine--D-glutamate ligase [Pseudomonadota bacterium]
MDWVGQRVLVLGLGATGRSAAEYCAARGARVVAADERPGLAENPPEIDGAVELVLGKPFPDPAEFDLVVPSPGVPAARYADRARRAWGDIELVGRALSVPIVAVTGTNGKSTTTLMIEALLREAGLRARAAGNLGRPALSLVGEPLDVAVLEVSSFQLEAIDAFRPRVAVVLNLSPDHLTRHGSMERYAAAKERLLMNQTAEDAAVLGFDDARVRDMAARAAARVVPFARRHPIRGGVQVDAGGLVVDADSGPQRVALDDWQLRGIHNLDNAAAALAAVVSLGVDPLRAAPALSRFRGLPHRCEVVAVRSDVTYVNDSKATNPGAAERALESFDAPLVWLAGGQAKGTDWGALAEVAARHARLALLFGEAAPALARVLGDRLPTETLPSLEAAVERAAAVAQQGEIVLLAPACASFDAYESFEARGEAFKHAVETANAAGGA